jgi:PncC family amidohydrolase
LSNTAREIENRVRIALDLSLRLKYLKPRGVSWANAFTFAESCTGGLLASSVTSVPGASAVFPGGIVTYSDRAKIEFLSVTPETIERHGAVSGQCAAEMASGALVRFGALTAVSVTGIAGPDGGSRDKPVGTVWFAIAHANGRMRLKRGYYPGRSRRGVQMKSVLSALDLLVRGLRSETG